MGKASRDRRDIYYRLAKEEGWRARSAYKLMQIDEQFSILTDTDGNLLERIVDLCSAPGSWSQVLSKRLWEPRSIDERSRVRIVGVDLQAMAPIPGVISMQGDITSQETSRRIISQFSTGEKAQLVVCDGAPDVTGMHDLDQFVQFQLIKSALNISKQILDIGGTFVCKVFRGRDSPLLSQQLRPLFSGIVAIAKPRSSRNSSLEAFVVCRGFRGPCEISSLTETCGFLPFVSCGDLSGYDADFCYPLENNYTSLPPVQPPINPPYSESCRKAKTQTLIEN
ncbi:putative tRNA (cytidine(32)/guanosine(34)-2'-O)-methyltransferase [Cichlidogyrus casuarinus]|uniref:Putative tRNA (cytidine(32)/guanosine(34)-2'-O)-methyltransferase n=1 Tax=Cichlidogyrus casuarinus TaxID=1844966 RepID=A0ABD2QMY7_9PLAT